MGHSEMYVFAGGGTGGHLFPGIALAHELLRRDGQTRIVFAGSQRDVERRVVGQHGFEHLALPAESTRIARRHPIRFAYRNLRAIRMSGTFLRRERPGAVIGLGGFASAPMVFAAFRQSIPVILLEQNVVPGRATRMLSRFASLVCVSFEETLQRLRTSAPKCLTGNPVRQSIVDLHADPVRAATATRPTLFILGGSQGAQAINESMLLVAEQLRGPLADWTIAHQTGLNQVDQVRRRYAELNIDAVVEPFFDDVTDWYQRAIVAVSRAGATTLAELACAGIPALLVPYPHAADNHQWLNAEVFANAGAAMLTRQGDFESTAHQIIGQLSPLLSDSAPLQQMKSATWRLAHPAAAVEIADHLQQLVAERNRSSDPVPLPAGEASAK